MGISGSHQRIWDYWRAVHRDGHLEVDKAFYSVPPEYLSRSVWVRWDTRLVRIFDRRMQQIAVHTRSEPGRFRTPTRSHTAARSRRRYRYRSP